MDKFERLHRLTAYLAETFSGGNSSIARDDEVDDGVVVETELSEVVALFDQDEIDTADLQDAIDALVTLSDAWGQGYDLASGDDLVNDDNETVSDILCRFHDEFEAEPAVPAI